MTKLETLTTKEKETTWITMVRSRQAVAISLIFDKVNKYLKDHDLINNMVSTYVQWNTTMRSLAETFLDEEFKKSPNVAEAIIKHIIKEKVSKSERKKLSKINNSRNNSQIQWMLWKKWGKACAEKNPMNRNRAHEICRKRWQNPWSNDEIKKLIELRETYLLSRSKIADKLNKEFRPDELKESKKIRTWNATSNAYKNYKWKLIK